MSNINKAVKPYFEGIRLLWRIRSNIISLVRYDFYQSYLSSYLGITWAIVSPLVTLTVLCIVFHIGFRVPPINAAGVPFIAWLSCGFICWTFFATALISGSAAVLSYTFLVRKAMFRTGLLPPIRVASCFIIHLIMMVFLLIILFIFDIYPTIYWLQWFYFVSILFIFMVGAAWLTSSIAVFVPDVTSLLAIVVNIGFWATPIFWSSLMVEEEWRWILSLNPAYYFVEGYRITFLENRWFWEIPLWKHLIFFGWLVFILALGIFSFKKLRPRLADVL